MPRSIRWVLLAVVLLMACGRSGSVGRVPSTQATADGAPSPRAEQRKTITIAIRADLNAPPTDLDRGGAKSNPSRFAHEFLNAYFVVHDHADEIQPLLAERLPSVDDGSWQVHEDGRMTVTWTLRPNTRWHDGHELTSDDVRFGWEVGSDPASQVGQRGVSRYIEAIDTPDARTVVMHWSQTSYLAGQLGEREFEVMPRHVLGEAFATSKETLQQHPYFTSASGFVGSGPFRMVDWVRDDQFTVDAFDQFFLGRPKLDRIAFKVIPDSRTSLANILSGAADVAYYALEFGEGKVIQDEWQRTGAGTVLMQPTSFQYLQPQFRLEYLSVPDLLEPDMRRALAHALNRADIAEGINPGGGMPSETNTLPGTPLGDEVARQVVGHPYDPARAAALFESLGWRRGPDGALQRGGERLRLELRVRNTNNETAALFALAQQQYQQAGIELTQFQAIGRDATLSVFYPGVLMVGGTVNQQAVFNVSQSRYIASVENRWTGVNYGGYANPAFDRAVDELDRAVRRPDQLRRWGEAWHALTEDVGTIGLYITPTPFVVRKGITGAIPPVPTGWAGWNIQQWDLQPSIS